MSESRNSDETDTPIDAEGLAILAKARRRAAFSMIIMLLGFMAVVLVIVYRLSGLSGSNTPDEALERVSIPAGAELVSAIAADGNLTLTFRQGEATTIRIIDGRTGEVISDIAVVDE